MTVQAYRYPIGKKGNKFEVAVVVDGCQRDLMGGNRAERANYVIYEVRPAAPNMAFAFGCRIDPRGFNCVRIEDLASRDDYVRLLNSLPAIVANAAATTPRPEGGVQ